MDESRWGNFLQTVQGWFPPGFPFGGSARTEPMKATRDQLLNAEAFIDPSRLFGGKLSVPYNPSVLVTRKGLNIFDQMKKDEQVKSALLFKKYAVLASGWEVVSPGDQDDDWEVTTFVRDVFSRIPGGMNRAVQKIMLGLDYGYSITEKVYGDGEGALAGHIVISRLSSAKPHYFDFSCDPYGQILLLLQKYVPAQQGIIELPPDKFIVYTHDPEFENPYGCSDLEAAYRAWWIKDNAYKWFAVLLERYGMPPLFALYNPAHYEGPQLSALKSVVKNIQNATMGLVPRSTKDSLEFWHAELAGRGKEVFLAALGRFDADIAKALLQPSLTGFSQEGGEQQSRGSLARANVHWKAFLQVVAQLQEDVASNAINSQLIPQLCDLNWAGLHSYPQFRFGRLDDQAELALFELWTKLVDGGVVNRIPDDETHVRKSLGFPDNDAPSVGPLPAKQGAGAAKPPVSEAQFAKFMAEAFSEEHRA